MPRAGGYRIIRESLFWKHLGRQRQPVVVATCVLLLQSLVVVGLPMPMRFILNNVLAPSSAPADKSWFILLPGSLPPAWLLAAAAACFAALFLAAAILEVGEEFWITRAVGGVIEGVRRDLLELLLSRRQGFVDAYRKADIVGRLSADVANLEALLSVGLPTLLRAVPTLVMILAVLGSINRDFALAMLAAVLTMYLFNSHFSAQMRGYERVGRRETNRLEQNAYQTLQAFPLIKSLSMERASFELMAANARAVTDNMVRRAISESLMSSSLMTTKNCMRMMILAVGGLAALRGKMSVGDLVLFLSYVDSVSSPVNELSKFSVKRAKAAVSLERISELAKKAAEFPEKEGERGLGGAGALPLRLREVSYARPDGPVILWNFCALFNPGDLIAVTGPSGAGKTTFLKLLNRLLDPAEGELLLGGHPMPDFRLAELRGYVTAIPQEEFFLSGTIRENLMIAAREPAQDETLLWEALERVHAREFVAALPDGLDTRIGDGGLRLSGGEERRLSVARAFLRPRRGIFVFDEPTSGLDPESANAFIASISALAGEGATVLWSTHRVEETASAMRILFFSPGRNPVLGVHEELLSSCPAYNAFLMAGSKATPRPMTRYALERAP